MDGSGDVGDGLRRPEVMSPRTEIQDRGRYHRALQQVKPPVNSATAAFGQKRVGHFWRGMAKLKIVGRNGTRDTSMWLIGEQTVAV